MDEAAIFNIIIVVLIIGLVLFTLKLGINVVPQSEVYVVERFGRYSRTLSAGLSLLTAVMISNWKKMKAQNNKDADKDINDY